MIAILLFLDYIILLLCGSFQLNFFFFWNKNYIFFAAQNKKKYSSFDDDDQSIDLLIDRSISFHRSFHSNKKIYQFHSNSNATTKKRFDSISTHLVPIFTYLYGLKIHSNSIQKPHLYFARFLKTKKKFNQFWLLEIPPSKWMNDDNLAMWWWWWQFSFLFRNFKINPGVFLVENLQFLSLTLSLSLSLSLLTFGMFFRKKWSIQNDTLLSWNNHLPPYWEPKKNLHLDRAV